jgi:hypothetical protein
MQLAHTEVFCFEGYRLDVVSGSMLAGDREIELRPKSFEVLCSQRKNSSTPFGRTSM